MYLVKEIKRDILFLIRYSVYCIINISMDTAQKIPSTTIPQPLTGQPQNMNETSKSLANERRLAEEKAKSDAMLDNIGDGVIGISDGGEILYVNLQAERMLGWEEHELLRKSLLHTVKLVNQDGKEMPIDKRPARTALFTKRKVESRDGYYVRKDGTKFSVSVTATPVILHGTVIGGVNVFRDITKEKEIDKMKTEFISLASHQLRTPLSAMKWFGEMLIDGDAGELNSEQRDLVDKIYKSNERMIQLVNTLLNISRIESGRIIIEPKPTDLQNLVQEVVTELTPRITKNRHHLAISVHEKLPLVSIDPKLVRHVYMNLLTNALKYTPKGGEVVVVISKSGNEIISQVSDNGYGIPENEQDQVFKKFFRAKNIAKVETEGTGLGLYLTYIIVQSSGGKIWFESKEGKGTTFWFILPIKGTPEKEGEVSLDT
jgi:PAS domain S-box-containing protein